MYQKFRILGPIVLVPMKSSMSGSWRRLLATPLCCGNLYFICVYVYTHTHSICWSV